MPVPVIERGVSEDPAIIEVGLTEVITGVTVGALTPRLATGEVPPPGAGLVTVTASVEAVDWSATVATNVSVVGLT
jgi:hypothetical protein